MQPNASTQMLTGLWRELKSLYYRPCNLCWMARVFASTMFLHKTDGD